MKASAGAVYTVYNQYLKRYTACQVAYIAPPDTVSKEPWAVILSLEWVGDAPLTAEELPHLRPLYKDFMYWPRELHLLRVPVEVPPQYTLVGTLPPFTDEPCRSYGGWNDGYDVYLQIRWQAIPEERRRAFKEAMESDEQTEIGGIPVKVSSHRVTDQYEPFDSALELKALPCLSTLICERWHPDLLEFLRENPFVDEVTLLSHGQRTLDLRGTSIRKLMLDMTGLEELWLCEGTEHIPASAAKKAANQYRKTRSQLMKLAVEPGEDAQAQALEMVAAYTQIFNKMGFIETEERDEIYMALRGILDALPGDMLQKDALIEHFDHVRDF